MAFVVFIMIPWQRLAIARQRKPPRASTPPSWCRKLLSYQWINFCDESKAWKSWEWSELRQTCQHHNDFYCFVYLSRAPTVPRSTQLSCRSTLAIHGTDWPAASHQLFTSRSLVLSSWNILTSRFASANGFLILSTVAASILNYCSEKLRRRRYPAAGRAVSV